MTATSFLLVAGCFLPAILSVFVLFKRPNHRLSSFLLFAIGIVLTVAAILFWRESIEWHAPGWLAIGFTPVVLKFDSLAAFFVLLLGVVCTCCAVYSPNYLEHLGSKINGRMYWSALFAFVAGMAGVLLSADAVVFLVAWEVMSLSSAALVVSEYRQHKAQRAAFIYMVATRIATIFLSAGFLLMYARVNNWMFESWHFSNQATWLPATCILLGLIIKAGVWPFHIWLPYAHPEAPSPVSALMSGVMVKIAVYGVIRFFILGQLNCQLLAYALFVLACISAFWGILFAINQRELKRLLAYSTVENVGLILIGLSLCIWAKNLGLHQIAQMALLAALLHTFGHALFKSLLFLCAGSVDYATHSREFSLLGGLNKNMPLTGGAFILGSAAICALPPLNGFTGKWCLYQALLQSSFSMPTLFDRAVCLGAIGVLSGVGALAVACFAKACGVAFLGRPRSIQCKIAHEVPLTMTLPQVFLSFGCIITGIAIPWLVTPLSPLLAIGAGTDQIAIPFALIPLWQFTVALVVLLGLTYLLVLNTRPAIYKTWDCGFGTVPDNSQVTADSFAQPIARIFTPVLRYNLTVDISGRDRRHFPEKIVVHPSMVSVLESRVYGPAASTLNRLSQVAGKLQSGSIHLYLLYVCIALVVLVLVGTNLW